MKHLKNYLTVKKLLLELSLKKFGSSVTQLRFLSRFKQLLAPDKSISLLKDSGEVDAGQTVVEVSRVQLRRRTSFEKAHQLVILLYLRVSRSKSWTWTV